MPPEYLCDPGPDARVGWLDQRAKRKYNPGI